MKVDWINNQILNAKTGQWTNLVLHHKWICDFSSPRLIDQTAPSSRLDPQRRAIQFQNKVQRRCTDPR